MFTSRLAPIMITSCLVLASMLGASAADGNAAKVAQAHAHQQHRTRVSAQHPRGYRHHHSSARALRCRDVPTRHERFDADRCGLVPQPSSKEG